MQITSLQHRNLAKFSRSSPVVSEETKPAPKSEEDVWTKSEAYEFVTGGLRFKYGKTVAKISQWWSDKLKSAPKVKMEKPVLMVPGFHGKPEQFECLIEQLTRDDSNGGQAIYINKGETFTDPECTVSGKPKPDTKVFFMVHGHEASPVEVADDMALATEHIEKATGERRPDVLAHSMGGLAARIHCDRGNEVGKLAMVGTPNQGSRAAMLTKAALVNGVGWAMAIAGVGVAAEAALSWMVPTVNGNEKLSALNDRWDQQKANTQATVVLGAKDFVTSNSYKNWGSGDGLIEESSLAVGDVKVQTFAGVGRKHHNYQVNDKDFNKAIREFFDWQETS